MLTLTKKRYILELNTLNMNNLLSMKSRQRGRIDRIKQKKIDLTL